jgi:drug/metabolite transporter (DMT)-like permease
VIARRRGLVLVVGAGAAFATSAPLARYCAPTHPAVIVFWRVALAASVLLLFAARDLWRTLPRLSRRRRLGIAAAGAVLGAHFVLFVWGLSRTSLPAAVTLVSLEPLAVVLLAWWLQRLPPTRLERVGLVVATLGALVQARGAGQGEHRLSGDLLVLGAVVLYGLYLAAARAFGRDLRATSYAALVYSGAALFVGVALLFLPGAAPLAVAPHAPWALVALALVPTLVGHTAVQGASRDLSPATVAMVSPAETVGGLVLGVVWLRLQPSPIESLGAAVVVAGVTLTLLGAPGGERSSL